MSGKPRKISRDYQEPHLIHCRKSKLRNQDPLSLGPQYEGSRVDREALLAGHGENDPVESGASPSSQSGRSEVDDPEDIEAADQETDRDEEISSDEAFGSGDSTKYQSYTFRGSRDSRVSEEKQPPVLVQGKNLGLSADYSVDDKAVSVNGQIEVKDPSDESEEDQEMLSEDIAKADESQEDISGSESADDSTNDDINGKFSMEADGSDDRAALRQIMAEGQKLVVATISQAAKADVEKGKAVKQQRTAFDALLNTRIRLQKALIATNSMSSSQPTDENTALDTDAIRAAEQAALNLWNTLDSLRTSLSSSTTPNKRPFSSTLSTSIADLASRMQSQESSSLSHRRAILTKWSHKIHPTAALPTRNKLNNTSTQQPLATLLDAQLSAPNIERLIKRTRIPRSCAPLQAASGLEDEQIYDDADFYTLLLRELVDQRTTSSATNPTNTLAPNIASLPAIARRDAKTKKVDTKASKGRKMRYTVHEKLQNFMMPEDRGTWGERQVDELFGSLLGRRVELREDGEDGEDGEEEGQEMEGWRLFGGA